MLSDCSSDSIPYLEKANLSLLTLNLAHGRDTALNQVLVNTRKTYDNLDAVADVLTEVNADIVALQEADAPSLWSGRFDHVAYLAGQADYACRVHGLHSGIWVASYGTALLTHASMREAGSVPFSSPGISRSKGYVSAQIGVRRGDVERRVTLVSVHLDFLRARTRARQIAEMTENLKSVRGPLIVLGDFNSEWSASDSQVKALAESLELQAFAPEAEHLATFSKLGNKRLDWILISQDLEFVDYRVLPDEVADHLAVYTELRFRNTDDLPADADTAKTTEARSSDQAASPER